MNATHEALINHASVKGVTCCHPMSGRYCAIGRERLANRRRRLYRLRPS
jgi:hypothetical protein